MLGSFGGQIEIWTLTGGLQIGYNPNTCSWFAQGVRALGSLFTNNRYTWYENAGFASIDGSSSGSRLKLRKSSRPSGYVGTLYLFVHPTNKANLRLLATKTIFESQVDKCVPTPPPPQNNTTFSNTTWNRNRSPGTGGGDPQCLSYDGFRFECNFLGEAVWSRFGLQNLQR